MSEAAPAAAQGLVDAVGGLLLCDYSPLSGALAVEDTLHPPSFRRQLWLTASLGEEIVGAAIIAWDSPAATADFVVAPSRRDAGIGTMLLDRCVMAAAREDIAVLRCKAPVASNGERFLHRRGAVPVGRGSRFRAAVSLVGERCGSVPIISWEGPVPDELVDGACRVRGVADHGRWRARDASWRATGYRWFAAAVRDDRSGGLVAISELVTTPRHPSVGFVSGTVVDPAHRGNGMAAAVKTGAVRVAVCAGAGIRTVVTFVSSANLEMQAVNRRLGFVPFADLAFWECVVRPVERGVPPPFGARSNGVVLRAPTFTSAPSDCGRNDGLTEQPASIR